MTEDNQGEPGRDSRQERFIQISAVIPCLNEQETIEICIKKAQKGFESLKMTGEVVVGDNGSTDDSVKIAEALGARVVHQPIKGYGAALQAAIGAARGEWVIMADADDSYDWADLRPMVDCLKKGADMVVGNRFKGGIMSGAMPPLHRYLGNPVLSFIARVLFHIPVGDFHCGMRGFTKAAYDRLKVQTTGMEFASEMIVRASWAGLNIKEAPVTLYPDKRNRPPHLRSFRDGWRHLRFLLTYAPNYVYFVPGLLLFFVGLVLCAALSRGPVILGGFFVGTHFLALGSMLTLVGFNVVVLGMTAKLAIWREMPSIEDKLVARLIKHFSLEWPLLIASLLIIAGLVVDGTLLFRWLTTAMPMEDTIHVAFLATTFFTLGVSMIFNAFLIKLLLDSRQDKKA